MTPNGVSNSAVTDIHEHVEYRRAALDRFTKKRVEIQRM
jgi:hypothetical protein